GTVADRTRLRGQVRPHAGPAFPPRCGIPAMASRQATRRLPLRSARGHDAVRARERLRRVESLRPTGFEQESRRSGGLMISKKKRTPDLLASCLMLSVLLTLSLPRIALAQRDLHWDRLHVEARPGAPRAPH